MYTLLKQKATNKVNQVLDTYKASTYKIKYHVPPDNSHIPYFMDKYHIWTTIETLMVVRKATYMKLFNDILSIYGLEVASLTDYKYTYKGMVGETKYLVIKSCYDQGIWFKTNVPRYTVTINDFPLYEIGSDLELKRYLLLFLLDPLACIEICNIDDKYEEASNFFMTLKHCTNKKIYDTTHKYWLLKNIGQWELIDDISKIVVSIYIILL